MMGNVVFLVLIPPIGTEMLSETSETIFMLSSPQAIFLAGFRASKISLLPYTEASEISMIPPDSDSTKPCDLVSYFKH